jgi:hypothetical protein
MDTKLSNEEIEIYSAIGLAHTKWAELEDMLCHVFCESVNPQDWSVADSAFWEINSVELRLDMTDAAVQKRLSKPAHELKASAAALLVEWKKAKQRTRERNASRNKLAHGSAVNIDGTLVYVPYYYGALRGRKSHAYFPETGIRVASSLPEERLNKHNIGSISRGFHVGIERLKRFLLALRVHNRAQFELDEATRQFFAEAQAQAARTSSDNQ